MADSNSLERDMALASKALSATSGKSAQGIENRYGLAYQQLVKAGLRQQLKHKYRSIKG